MNQRRTRRVFKLAKPAHQLVLIRTRRNVAEGFDARLDENVIAEQLDVARTYHQWNERACRLANALLGLGLVKGERVAILAYNCVPWLEIYVAIAKAGLVAVPVNFRLLGAELRYIVADADAVALIVLEALVERVETVRADLPIIAGNYIHFGSPSPPAGFRAYEAHSVDPEHLLASLAHGG